MKKMPSLLLIFFAGTIVAFFVWYSGGKVFRPIPATPTLTPTLIIKRGPDTLPSQTQELAKINPTSTSTEISAPTQTPYITIFNGFFNCRENSNTSSKQLVLIQGQQVTILAQNQGWLYVSVQYFDDPCWVSMSEIRDLDPNAIPLVPLYLGTITPTFTLPAGSQTKSNDKTPHPKTPITITTVAPTTKSPTTPPCYPPAKPSGLSYQPSNGNNFILSWSAVSDADKYRVHSSGGNESDTNSTSKTVEVKNNQSFTFYVTAINKCGESPASDRVTISR